MAKDYARTDRIGELIQRELASIIAKEIRDPKVGLISVAAVKVTRDLAYAKVYISRFGEPAEAKVAVEKLNKASPFLRFLLAKKIDLRVMPALQFVYDETLVTGNALAALIDKAVASDKSEEENSDESDPI